jgi:predicted dehydrogenase
MNKKKSSPDKFTRREFIGRTSAAAAGLIILPGHVVGGLGHTPPSDKLNIAAIGVGKGGKGKVNLENIVGQNIVALCDVDWDYASPVFKTYPNAVLYKDYRLMLENQKDIEAVVIATPDHSHYHPAAMAMKMGKHVYVQKPLTHSIWEARELTRLGRICGVATQMGTEGHSSDTVRELTELIQSGVIGEISEVHAWTNRPIWPQGMDRPFKRVKIPKTLEWNLFLGSAPYRPYHPAYTPWNWRGWWDFGTGALGDMGCHILDVPFYALKLGWPVSFEASSSPVNVESAPVASRVEYVFPEREPLPDLQLPEVKLIWYDGGLMPPRIAELSDGQMMGGWGGGNLYIGSKGKIISEDYGNNFKVLPANPGYNRPPASIERIPDDPLGGGRHEMDWVRACKESVETRKKPASDFDLAGPLSETVIAGNLAIRLQGLQRKIAWDPVNIKIKNVGPEEKMTLLTTHTNYKNDKWTPSLNVNTREVNALETAEEWINHKYREF